MEDNFPRPGISGCFKHTIFIEFVEQEAELRRQCKQWGAAVNTDDTSLAGLLFTSCWVTQFLTGHGLVLVHGLGLADPSFRRESIPVSNSFWWLQESLACGHVTPIPAFMSQDLCRLLSSIYFLGGWGSKNF